jgi:hypothetical protein
MKTFILRNRIMINIYKQLIKKIVTLFNGFGGNRPIAALIRLVADLPPNKDSIPKNLKLDTLEGNCPVCGESFADQKYVLCKDCLTPHHKHCFEWNGKCAQYACGSTKIHIIAATEILELNYSES